MKQLMFRGALAGIAGGLAGALTLLLLGEQSISEAIALEEAAAVEGHGHEALFSRPTQILGGSLGVVLFGIFVGTIFAVVFASNRHRLGNVADWSRARRLAAVAFVTVYLVPFLKYPPNPPAVGDPATIDQRTVAYLAMLVVSVLAMVASSRIPAWSRRRGLADHLAGPLAVVAWALLIGIAYVVLPGNPDVVEAPATLVWRFRMASAGGQAAFWATAGVVFGWLAVRAEQTSPAAVDAAVLGS